MHTQKHTEETKKKISESLKKRWAKTSPEEMNQRKRKLKAFYEQLENEERERNAKEWAELHKQYIMDEYKRLFC